MYVVAEVSLVIPTLEIVVLPLGWSLVSGEMQELAPGSRAFARTKIGLSCWFSELEQILSLVARG